MPDGEERQPTWWRIFPWQTPTGAGFRAPWTSGWGIPEPAVSPYEYYEVDPNYMGLTPQIYWEMLQNMINYQIATGTIKNANQAEQLMARASEMLSTGQWGTGLPLYIEINKAYLGNLSAEEQALVLGQDDTLTDFEKEQVARWARLDEESRRRTDLEQARWEAEFRLSQQQQQGQSDRERQLEWELELERLGKAPADWIKRWELEHNPPFQRQDMTLEQRAGEAEWALKTMREALDRKREDLANETSPDYFRKAKSFADDLQALAKKEGELMPWIEQQRALGQQYLAEKAKYGASAVGGGELLQPNAVGTPPAPAWLSKFATSQVTGQPITRENIATPSGQAWTRTPWSVREGLRGYTEWAGFRPYEDIMQHMALMQPRDITASGAMWRPTRQWV